MRQRPKKGTAAVSPVIATVIIVAIAITVAVGVGLWVMGITGSFTRFEKLEIVSTWAEKSGTSWTVHVTTRNSGSADASISDVFINGRPAASYSPAIDVSALKADLKAGNELTDKTFTLGTGFASGQTVELVLHTASGRDYPKTVVLP